jgi:hypothetical protein
VVKTDRASLRDRCLPCAMVLLVGCTPGDPRPGGAAGAESIASGVSSSASTKAASATTGLLPLPRRLPQPARPRPGSYQLVEAFSIRGCVRETGGCFAHCVEEGTRTYPIGEGIEANVFLWDDSSQEWGAKVVVFGQNRSIPMRFLARVD